MSTIIMSACWPLKMPPSPKAVLISLADNANDAGVCWPSIGKICERTCLGRTAVIEAIKWLERAGLLSADRTNGRHTTYQIELDALKQGVLFDGSQPVREPDQSGRRTGPAGGPNQSGRRTAPVRQADTNRQEPSRTVKREERAPAGTRLPPDWQPSAEDLAFARRERPDLDHAVEAEKFRDYWHGAAGSKARKVDWSATWRNWIRRAEAPKGGATTGSARAAAPERDWREPSETPLEREINFIRQQHHLGVIDDAQRDRQIAAARKRFAPEEAPA